MPLAKLHDVSLYYEEAGTGFPLVLCHEFGGSLESWREQVRFFARRYRVITYNARGYPPSDVPADSSAYSEEQAVEDLYGLLQHLGIEQAYVGGISMGGTAALHFGRRHPEAARALIIAAAGTGSTDPDRFRQQSRQLASQLDGLGMAALDDYAAGPTRVQLRRKDPAGWQEFARLLRQHSPLGSALTLRGVQAGRRPVFDYEAELKALDLPALILVGDEDEPSLEPSLFLKRTLPCSGLVVFPQSGHAINLEEPELFNNAISDFLTAVEAGKWSTREQGSGVGFLASGRS
jgi:pimeloyl-ACP methyl ester carboxylesterase